MAAVVALDHSNGCTGDHDGPHRSLQSVNRWPHTRASLAATCAPMTADVNTGRPIRARPSRRMRMPVAEMVAVHDTMHRHRSFVRAHRSPQWSRRPHDTSFSAGRSLRPAGLHAPPAGHDTPSHHPPRRFSAHPTAVRSSARHSRRAHTRHTRTTTMKTTQGNMLLRNLSTTLRHLVD
jgi:hypothetical protein